MNDTATMTVPVLITEFEKDITSTRRGKSMGIKLRDSAAMKQLIELGRKGMPEILTHVENTFSGGNVNLDYAWTKVLQGIGTSNMSQTMPSNEDRTLWLAWAKSQCRTKN
jgi:hypothetical protein